MTVREWDDGNDGWRAGSRGGGFVVTEKRKAEVSRRWSQFGNA